MTVITRFITLMIFCLPITVMAVCPLFRVLMPNPTYTLPIPSFANQTAGSSFTAYVQRFEMSGPSCIQSTFSGTEAAYFNYDYDDPNAGTIAPLINGISIGTSPTAINLTYISGVATINIRYDDVGLVDFSVREIPAGTAHSQTMGFLPADFSISVTSNPGATSASDPVFKKTGEDFIVTVTALNSLGGTTPNFGNENTAESLRLFSNSLVLPSGGRNGTNNDGAIENDTSFSLSSPGVLSGTQFRFDEVGIIQLAVEIADQDYLGMGNVISNPSGNVGRFTPADFNISNLVDPVFTNDHFGCPRTFHYLGEDLSFLTLPSFDFQAINHNAVITENYTGDFFKLPSFLNGTMDEATTTVDLNQVTNNVDGINIFNLAETAPGEGSASFQNDTTYRLTIPIGSVPVAPFDATFQLDLTFIDDDAVAYSANPIAFGDNSSPATALGFDISSKIYQGRIHLFNALGSELLPLRMLVNLEYFNGQEFIRNIDDSCTLLDETIIPLILTPSPASLTSTATWQAGGFADMKRVIDGQRIINFSAPNDTGYIDVTLTLDDAYSWRGLKYDWPYDAAGIDLIYDDNPQARLSFGLFDGADNVIFTQEKFD